MLIPRKVKHRKHFRGKMRGISNRGQNLEFGSFGLKAQSRGWLTSRQIEAARRALTRFIKREGQVWIRVFPDRPVTSQPNETGMGGGKGSVDHYVCTVTPGRIIFEMDGVEQSIAKQALKLAQYKLPIKTKIISKP
ncbi:MAG: large subunit ribosomal protein L16 [Candidatus Berkelbacteria bacterium Licking1014_7]|uniref:Large ribosomal subunit protein uL16 n=1 Tax=Candidatus Berkelbacteria bacterium Licking1014_7 TaxID=2017147 RepID=A0A554LKJ7_9BACT|nr:MAG: large subunit ribosomal protein L16 [Candidatus Berkelbacteria bacterium Licking1014_7]